MKLASITPFIAISILGIAVFSGQPVLNHKIDLTQWRSNQQILLLIENCQDGQLSASACSEKIPDVLDQCRAVHVLACDDSRLEALAGAGHLRVGIE